MADRGAHDARSEQVVVEFQGREGLAAAAIPEQEQRRLLREHAIPIDGLIIPGDVVEEAAVPFEAIGIVGGRHGESEVLDGVFCLLRQGFGGVRTELLIVASLAVRVSQDDNGI